MTAPWYDIVVVGDLRFPGGTSAAVAEELRVQAGAGYRIGLLHLKGPILRYPHPIHLGIRACIDQGLADVLDPDVPVTADLVLAHHPSLFTHLPRRVLPVTASRRLLIVHHPPLDGAGTPAYDWVAVHRHATAALGGELLWAPVGPTVRRQFARLENAPPLYDADWVNVLDQAPWPGARDWPNEMRPTLGRHSRPDPLKWPDNQASILAAYPDDPAVTVRILGGGPFLRELVGDYPRNWDVRPFNALPPERFLATIDFFVYFHHSRWVEAFGRTALEAMASGAVCILPPSFQETFADGAIYATPEDVHDLVRRLHADRRRFARQSREGAALVRDCFGPEAHLAHLRRLIGSPRGDRHLVRGARRRRRVLFVTSNGVGIGHLTRMLAVAKRCPPPLEPMFLTLSQAIRIVREQGYLCEHLPFHAALGCDIARWNDHLREEVNELISFYDPAVLVFDGNVPYRGLVDALARNPDVWSVWCRRGLWQPGRGQEALTREGHFDAVIEPRDLAGGYDRGLTLESRARTRLVDPIRLLDEAELVPRDEARAALGLDGRRRAALIQLGAGNNFDYEAFRRAAIAALRERYDADVLVADWPISERPPDLPEGVRRIDTFPLSRYLRAFDLVLSAVGYNSFHEVLLAGVPAIFVPNEHPQQDDQLARARFAEHHGLGVCLRVGDIYRLSANLERLFNPAERQQISTRCAGLERSNGAQEVARFIEEMAYSRKVDRP